MLPSDAMRLFFVLFALVFVNELLHTVKHIGDHFYCESNIRELERRARDMDAGRNTTEHDLIDAEDLVHA